MLIRVINTILILLFISTVAAGVFVYFDPVGLFDEDVRRQVFGGIDKKQTIYFVPSNSVVSLAGGRASFSDPTKTSTVTLVDGISPIISEDDSYLTDAKLRAAGSATATLTGEEGCGELKITVNLDENKLEYLECVAQRF